jgi:gluconolactonase
MGTRALLALMVGVGLGAACSPAPGNQRPGDGAAGGGVAGSGATGGGAGDAVGGGGVSATGNAGTTAGAGGGDAGAAGTTGGASGSGDGSAGAASADGGPSGSVGADGGGSGDAAGGGGLWGPNGPKKQFSCPAPPYPAQMMGASTDVCVGFAFNYNWNEGPTWIASAGAFFFSNFPIGQFTGGDILKYTPGGACEVWLHDVGCNGLGVSPSGNLLGACQGPRAIMEYDVKTKVGRQIATMANGKMLDSPNDLIARSDGNIYFSNRTAENGNRPVGLGEALVRIDPLGVTSVIQMGGLNGVALSPDETKLYVVEMGTWTLDAQGVPGQKGGPTPGGDGIAVDCAGSILINGTNSAFGGADGKTLLIVGGDTKARTVTMTVPGLP